MAKLKQNPPPTTKAGKSLLVGRKDDVLEIELYVEVLPDGTVAKSTIQGLTSYNPVGSGGGAISRTPGFEFQRKGGVDVITKINGRAQIKGIVRIQTVYGPSANATKRSGYGRGTTAQDELAGNTSLGFHESCHRADFLEYLKNTPLPTFAVKVGMTKKAYTDAAAAFRVAVNKFFGDMNKYSDDRTDEVGYKRSTYNSQGPRP